MASSSSAGPLAGTEHGRVRVLLIVDAENEDEIRRDSPTIPRVHGAAPHGEYRALALLVGADSSSLAHAQH